MKRLLDIVFAGVGLLVIAPIFVACAAAVRLDSTGPVFFRQERVGRGGSRFQIIKFRTMTSDAELLGPLVSISADPRITRVGHFLRRHKLDEIPQLINVIRGEMSMVGPRPEVPKYVAMYPAAIRDRVLSVRPGITDLASIEFVNENAILGAAQNPEHAYVHDVLPRKLQFCLAYVDRQSTWLDLRIMLQTVCALMGCHSNKQTARKNTD